MNKATIYGYGIRQLSLSCNIVVRVAVLTCLLVDQAYSCALPYWWLQQYSFPDNYLHAMQPQRTVSYREMFQAFDPHSFVHTKEYTEYTWWEVGIPAQRHPVIPKPELPHKKNGGTEVPRRHNGNGKKEPEEHEGNGHNGIGEEATESSVEPERNGEEEHIRDHVDDLKRINTNDVELLQAETKQQTNQKNRLLPRWLSPLWNDDSLNDTPVPCPASEADIHSLRSMIEKMFNYPRTGEENKEKTRADVLKKFKEFGLQVWTQNFTAPPAPGLRGQTDATEGVNLIGVIPGAQRGKLEDGIVLVGAHYDTVADSNGVDDNGSGLAVMLEIAKMLTQPRCRLNNTLMFVAFDMQENGSIGSNFFVDNYLIPEELKRARGHFQGAFILDGIMNYNNGVNTQELPLDYAESLPGLQYFMNNTGNRGDFLAMISRNKVDSELTKKLMDAWQKLGDHQYKLFNLAINMGETLPTAETIDKHLNFLNSDHSTFWYHNSSSNYPETLNAVLLTDTGPFRGQMKKCYHAECDDLTAMSPEKLQFAKKTANALTATLVEMTKATAKGVSLKCGINLLLFQSFFVIVLLQFFKKL